MYAITNAFQHINNIIKVGILPDEVFISTCRGISKNRWPDVLWEGTRFGDMQKMVKRAIEDNDLSEIVQVRYPFSKTEPDSNDDYWQQFDNLFIDESSICAIVGLEEPSMHWIVAGRDGASRVLKKSDVPIIFRVHWVNKSESIDGHPEFFSTLLEYNLWIPLLVSHFTEKTEHLSTLENEEKIWRNGASIVKS